MKCFFTWLLTIVAALVLQSTFFSVVTYHGIKPDLLLAVVISSSLLAGRDHGVVIGFFSGVLQDLVSGTFFGMHTFSKMVLGYCFGMAEAHVFKEHFLLPVIAMSLATLANTAILSTLMFFLGYQVNVFHYALSVLGPLLFYQVLLAIPIHKAIYRIHRWLKD